MFPEVAAHCPTLLDNLFALLLSISPDDLLVSNDGDDELTIDWNHLLEDETDYVTLHETSKIYRNISNRNRLSKRYRKHRKDVSIREKASSSNSIISLAPEFTHRQRRRSDNIKVVVFIANLKYFQFYL